MSQADWEEFLELLWPSRSETSLLQDCLLEGERGRRAFLHWADLVSSPGKHSKRPNAIEEKRILPLLVTRVSQQRHEIPNQFSTWLRAAYLYEKTRTLTFQKHLRPVLSTLVGNKLRFLALRGVALAGTVY